MFVSGPELYRDTALAMNFEGTMTIENVSKRNYGRNCIFKLYLIPLNYLWDGVENMNFWVSHGREKRF